MSISVSERKEQEEILRRQLEGLADASDQYKKTSKRSSLEQVKNCAARAKAAATELMEVHA